MVVVISYPDYCGGRQHTAAVYPDVDSVVLGDFECVEAQYDNVDKALKSGDVFINHYEPLNEEAYDVEITIEELIEGMI